MRDLPSFMWRGNGWAAPADGDEAWVEQTTNVQEGVERRSEEGQTPPPLLTAAASQQMRGGRTTPEETEDLPDAIATDTRMPMLMTVQDGKPVLRVDPKAKRLLHACSGALHQAGDEAAPSKQSEKRVASLQSGVPGISY
eukprot:3679082-Amphidinium_carterae.1